MPMLVALRRYTKMEKLSVVPLLAVMAGVVVNH
jgi:hypothetical protein